MNQNVFALFGKTYSVMEVHYTSDDEMGPPNASEEPVINTVVIPPELVITAFTFARDKRLIPDLKSISSLTFVFEYFSAVYNLASCAKSLLFQGVHRHLIDRIKISDFNVRST